MTQSINGVTQYRTRAILVDAQEEKSKHLLWGLFSWRVIFIQMVTFILLENKYRSV